MRPLAYLLILLIGAFVLRFTFRKLYARLVQTGILYNCIRVLYIKLIHACVFVVKVSLNCFRKIRATVGWFLTWLRRLFFFLFNQVFHFIGWLLRLFRSVLDVCVWFLLRMLGYGKLLVLFLLNLEPFQTMRLFFCLNRFYTVFFFC